MTQPKVPQYIQITEIENKYLFQECQRTALSITEDLKFKEIKDTLLLAKEIDKKIVKSGKSIKHANAYLARFYQDKKRTIIKKFLLDFFGKKITDIFLTNQSDLNLADLEGQSDYFNKKLQKEVVGLIAGIPGQEAYSNIKERPLIWLILQFYLAEKYRIENSVKEEKKLLSLRSNIEKLAKEKPTLPNMEIKKEFSVLAKREYDITGKIMDLKKNVPEQFKEE